MTRFLAFGDLHLGAGEHLGREPGDRLRDQEKVLEQIVALAQERQVDAVLCGGDLFEGPTVTPEQYAAFLRPMRALAFDVPLLTITGNGRHDCAMRAVTAPEVLSDPVYVLARPGIHMVGDTAICALPWAPVTRLVAARGGGDRDLTNEDAAEHLLNIARGLIDEASNLVKPYSHFVLLLHWSIEGAAFPTGLSVDMAREPILPLAPLQELGYDAIVASHIHKSQMLSGSPPILYTGSPLPLNFGESSVDHGCWIVDLDQGGAEFVPLDSRPLMTLELEPGAGDAGVTWPEMWVGELETAIVRVRYTATQEQAHRIDNARITAALYEAGAYNVLPVEVEIVREQRARVAQIDEQLAPLDALDLWMASQDVPEDRGVALAELTSGYLEEIA